MISPYDLNLGALAVSLQDGATRLQAAARYQAVWAASFPLDWAVQMPNDPPRDCAACGLPIAIGQPYWCGTDDTAATHTGPAACAAVVFAIIGLAGGTWGITE